MVSINQLNIVVGVSVAYFSNYLLIQFAQLIKPHRCRRPGMQTRWQQEGLPHVCRVTQLALGYRDNGPIPVHNDVAL